MHDDANRKNGTKQMLAMSKRAGKLVLTLSVMLSLAACAGMNSTGTGSRVACSGWKPITFSTAKDTKETVTQVRVHNQTGRNLKCW